MSETTQTDKEALGRFLVQRLSEEDPTGTPLTVAELRRQLLPYPACRDALDFASKAEYDEAMLELLSDEGWLVIEDDALKEALEEERSAPEPGLAFLGEFSPSFLHPGPRLTEAPVEDDLDFLESLDEVTPDDDEEPTEGEVEEGEEGEMQSSDEEQTGVEEIEEPGEVETSPAAAGNPSATGGGGDCWSCESELPVRPDLRYCPFCGSDQTAPECLNCQADLEMPWSYCPACGTATGRP